MLRTVPSITSLPPQETREIRESGQGPFGPIVLLDQAENRIIGGPDGPVTVRVLQPEVVNGVYLHIHGGGGVFGRAHHQDSALWDIATTCNVTVVSVDYRLAPEHPYPAGPDDCEAVAVWLASNAKAEFGSDRLVIGGESAGAHFTAITLVRMRDRHAFMGFSGAVLTYGAYDMSFTPSVRRWGDRNLVLNTPTIEWFIDSFVEESLRRDPDVSPLYADLSNMPSALFTIGTLDPLVDDTLFMHSRWIAAGNQADIAIYPGGVHGFTLLPCRIGKEAIGRSWDFIRRSIAKEA